MLSWGSSEMWLFVELNGASMIDFVLTFLSLSLSEASIGHSVKGSEFNSLFLVQVVSKSLSFWFQFNLQQFEKVNSFWISSFSYSLNKTIHSGISCIQGWESTSEGENLEFGFLLRSPLIIFLAFSEMSSFNEYLAFMISQWRSLIF